MLLSSLESVQMRLSRLGSKRGFVAIAYVACAASALAARSALAVIPTYDEVKASVLSSDLEFQDRNGKVIQVLRSNAYVRQLGWVSLTEISPALKEAVIQSEDQRFYSHHGVDWIAAGKAAGRRLFGKVDRGASTISMQVTALLDQTLKARHGRRNWEQKLGQVTESFELEKSWTKDEILEAYLNLIFFRGELQGVKAASRGLFDKDPSGLNREESLILAALIRSPEAPVVRVKTRACELGRVLSPSYSCDALGRKLSGARLKVRAISPAIALAPHAARAVLKSGHHMLTLDERTQIQVIEILRRHVLALKDRNVNDAAALVLDNQSGDVLAYVGSLGALSDAGHVDGVQAQRQAGSTLKPFLYGIALEQRLLTAASKLDDSPTDIALGNGFVYRPRDFDHEFHGFDVSLRTSLASSLNVPAVRTLKLIGVETLVERLKKLGFENLRSADFYGPSLALGSADVSLWELTNAYRALANGGRWSQAHLVSGEKTSIKKVIAPEAVFVISDILSDRESRALTFSFDTPMGLPFWAAAKTGTSKDMRDNWCVGYTSRYTVGVWTGNFSGASMWDVSGVSGAAPAWADIMQALHRVGKDRAPSPPPGVLRFAGEWYLKGTQPNEEDESARSALASSLPISHQAKIIYPVQDMLIANDPDIPEHLQKVFFESNIRNPSFQWVLNDQVMGTARSRFAWRPGAPGMYFLKLVNSDGKVVDQVRFAVRGWKRASAQ